MHETSDNNFLPRGARVMNRAGVATNGAWQAKQTVAGSAIGPILGVGVALLGMLLTATPAAAQLTSGSTAVANTSVAAISLPSTATPKVRVIEWNLPAQADATPGAVIVDTMGQDSSRMWFV